MNRQKNKKMHVKRGDLVQIKCGDYKGEVGEIIKVLTKNSKVIIKNINVKTKHIRPSKEGETGQILKIEAPIHSSNVMLYSKMQQISSRYHYIIDENKNKTKQFNKTREIIKDNEYE